MPYVTKGKVWIFKVWLVFKELLYAKRVDRTFDVYSITLYNTRDKKK